MEGWGLREFLEKSSRGRRQACVEGEPGQSTPGRQSQLAKSVSGCQMFFMYFMGHLTFLKDMKVEARDLRKGRGEGT